MRDISWRHAGGLRLVRVAIAGVLTLPLLGGCGDSKGAFESGSSKTTASSSTTSSEPSSSTTSSEPSTEPSVATEPSTTEAPTTTTEPKPERQELQVIESGFSTFHAQYQDTPVTSFGAILKNPNAERYVATYVSAHVSFLDGTGKVLGTAEQTFPAILPGQSVAFGDEQTDLPAGTAKLDVQALPQNWEETDKGTGSFAISGISTRTEEFGGQKTTATLKSTFVKDQKSVLVAAIYRDAGRKIIGGAYSYQDFVPHGGQIGIELTSISEVPGVAATEVYAAVSLD